MSDLRNILGRKGEKLAHSFLEEQGYRILVTNYRCPFGEIDIIAQEKDVLCFIEVRVKTSDEKGDPFESITRLKQKHISQAAWRYVNENSIIDVNCRFDVISIVFNNTYNIDILKDAFESSL